MDDTSGVINASDLFADDPGEMFGDLGEPDYQRRLTDKILAAFNHAYSVGESEIADVLKAALKMAESRGTREFPARRSEQAVDQADAWIQFVAARDHYKALVEGGAADADECQNALRDMKSRYQVWSNA